MSVPPKRMRASPSYLLYKVGEVCSTKEFPYDRLSFAGEMEQTKWSSLNGRHDAMPSQCKKCIYVYIYSRYEEWLLRPRGCQIRSHLN